jgi:hypothetical protein
MLSHILRSKPDHACVRLGARVWPSAEVAEAWLMEPPWRARRSSGTTKLVARSPRYCAVYKRGLELQLPPASWEPPAQHWSLGAHREWR